MSTNDVDISILGRLGRISPLSPRLMIATGYLFTELTISRRPPPNVERVG